MRRFAGIDRLLLIRCCGGQDQAAACLNIAVPNLVIRVNGIAIQEGPFKRGLLVSVIWHDLVSINKAVLKV
ncbi:MAG: hypothetical protein HZA12_07560 [Nitrospirae bacterium]|nr:hypothetical protein [Nitrospirota bacterium]